MSFLESLEIPQPKIGPALLVGAASPLWGYFSCAALGGVAYWWMTRWTEASNLEALYAAWSPARLAEMAPVTPASLESAAEVAPPLGGESAPVSPVAAVATPETPAPTIAEAAPEPVEPQVAPAEPAAFAEPATARPRRTAPPPASPIPDA